MRAYTVSLTQSDNFIDQKISFISLISAANDVNPDANPVYNRRSHDCDGINNNIRDCYTP